MTFGLYAYTGMGTHMYVCAYTIHTYMHSLAHACWGLLEYFNKAKHLKVKGYFCDFCDGFSTEIRAQLSLAV